jgi:hypothetical protein
MKLGNQATSNTLRFAMSAGSQERLRTQTAQKAGQTSKTLNDGGGQIGARGVGQALVAPPWFPNVSVLVLVLGFTPHGGWSCLALSLFEMRNRSKMLPVRGTIRPPVIFAVRVGQRGASLGAREGGRSACEEKSA